jgi:hypothetical protein
MSSKAIADHSHDSDNQYPRSPSHIYESNKHIRDKFYKIFKPDNPLYPLSIPIVPSYGNNDVWPYLVQKNILTTDTTFSHLVQITKLVPMPHYGET